MIVNHDDLPTNGSAVSRDRAGKCVAIAIELDKSVPWHHECYQGIQAYADQQGWRCVVDPYLVGMTGRSGIGDYDGVVGRINHDIAAAAAEHRIPVVNHWCNSPVRGLPMVTFDAPAAGRLVADHLIKSGYKRFAHLGMIGDRITEHEVASMSSVLQAHGYAPPYCLNFDQDFEASRQSVIHMRQVLSDWIAGLTEPIGVMVQACHTARYLSQICSELGRSVPNDVGIVVHFGNHVVVSSATPTLSSVDVDCFSVGYQSAAMLDRLMNGEPAEPATQFIEPHRVIVRESSDVFLSPDPLVTQAMHYIAEHCTQTLRVEDLAEAMSTSRRTLERRFEEVLGSSVYGEIRRLRTEYIKRILTESNRALAAVASDCGFTSVSHFTRFFRKEVGVTPGAFRRQQRP